MKQLRMIVISGIAFLLMLIVTGTFVAHAWNIPANSHQQSVLTMSLTKMLTTQKGAEPAINLVQPSYSLLTPILTSSPTSTLAFTTVSARQPTIPLSSRSLRGRMTAEEAKLAQKLLTQINRDRVSNGGLAAYRMSDPLVASAYKHNQVMKAGCGLSHQCSGEADPCTRMSKEGVRWTTCGENVGYARGYSNHWQAVLAMHHSMMNEKAPDDGHRQNLLSRSFHKIGIGISISGNAVWLTEDFTN
jgi:uncharacterized protein YkwD